jgi:ribosome-associated toxin RatA of RatAB toxin-antitoxin module
MIVIEKKIKCNIGKLFNILNDINNYPNFFEGCSFGKKYNISKNTYDGTLNIKFMDKMIELKTKNKVLDNKFIYFDLVDGPFKRLNGFWSLTDISKNVTLVAFNIDYELKNFFIDKASKLISKKIIDSLVDDFKFKVENI